MRPFIHFSLLALALVVGARLPLHAVIVLDDTTKILRVTTTAAVSLDYFVSWTDTTTTAFTPAQSDGNIVTATTTTITAAPAASTQRRIYAVMLVNRSTTTAQTVTVKFDVSGTERFITPSTPLQPGEALSYEDATGWRVLDAQGRVKQTDSATSGLGGLNIGFYKVGAAAEAAAQFYSWNATAGYPGAWATGAPGLAGRVTDGTTVADAGCMVIPNAPAGANYVANLNLTGTVAHNFFFADVLWVNTGAVVTTTTAQTVNSVAFPARDLNGSTNGAGVQIALLVTAANTNAGTIANTTISYTNDQNTPGRTGTIALVPITPVTGTLLPFQLQAGDTGVRSVQSVTLGTSYVTGSLSLIAYVPTIGLPMTLANVGALANPANMNPGIRLYNGVCLLPFGLMSAATATTITGTLIVQIR